MKTFSCCKCGRRTIHASEGRSLCLACLLEEAETTLKRFSVVGPAAVQRMREHHGMTASYAPVDNMPGRKAERAEWGRKGKAETGKHTGRCVPKAKGEFDQ